MSEIKKKSESTKCETTFTSLWGLRGGAEEGVWGFFGVRLRVLIFGFDCDGIWVRVVVLGDFKNGSSNLKPLYLKYVRRCGDKIVVFE